MDPALIISIVATVIAGGSMIFAGLSARHSRRSAATAKAALGIEQDRRDDELMAAQSAADEARHARLDASLTSSDALVIRNLGQCRARQVQLELESDERGYQPPQLLFDEAREIGPGVGEVWKILTHMGTAASYTVRMTWTDDDGNHEDSQLVHI